MIKALIEILMNRYRVKYNSTDPNTIIKTIAEVPITPAEAIVKTGINMFPVADLTERIGQLDANPTEYDDIYGRVDTSSKEIQVSIKLSNGKDVQENEILITLYHEIIHAILLTGQYMKSSEDEPLVEWLARCILSLKNQKIL